MRKQIAVLACLLACVVNAHNKSDGLAKRGMEFSAPVVAIQPSAAESSIGSIIYDINSGGFLGLFADGTWKSLAFSSYTAPTVVKFSSGSGSYTAPAGVVYLKVKLVGGGGGGGTSGTSASGVTAATAGAQTYFGASLLVANGVNGGGYGGTGSGAGGGGGVSINSPAYGTGIVGGQGGAYSRNYSVSIGVPGGAGGVSGFGQGGPGGTPDANGVTPVANTGGGGGGGGCNTATSNFSGPGGGAGGYIEAIVPNPSGSYSYSVGTGGVGSTAGTNGRTGGDGAAGYIEITEYYQ